MNELEKLILEIFASIKEVDADEIEKEGTTKLDDASPALRKNIEDRYGRGVEPKYDFLSTDGTTYFKTTSVNTTTGSIGHKIIRLPSFDSLYNNYSSIISDLKSLMRSDEIRKDQAARELFELIKTNFRKLQRYLRTERPEQYNLLRMRRSLGESVFHLNNLITSNIPAPKMLLESLLEDLEEAEEADKPTPEEEPNMDAPKETVLEDATDEILGKFPTLKKAIIKLQTDQFKEFVESIDWISPRPSSFRVNIKNGQYYILKWTGTGFEAQILGKRYYIDKIDDYQQALDKLGRLYREGPMSGAGEGEAAEPSDTGGGGGGGGDFPGGEGGAEGGEEGEDPVAALGGEVGGEEGGEDLTGEPIDFEEPAEEPEA
jgi:hypothetical protein